jgi:ribosomal subunit interface protein
MDITFTGRGVQVTDDLRSMAERKLSTLGRLEPRATRLDIEVIGEHHPKIDGAKRVEASLRIPRKTFRAHAEAEEVATAVDRVRDKLERQLRDHHGKKRATKTKGAVGYAQAASAEGEADGETD